MGKVTELKDSNFDSKTGKGIVLVDFYATWCGPCKMLAPMLDAVAESTEGIKIFKAEAQDACSEAVERFKITTVPTLVVLKDGVEVERRTGILRRDQLDKLVADALAA